MVTTIQLSENRPFPNNTLPVLYYEKALTEVFVEEYTAEDVIELFERNGYVDGWVNGIMDKHHFHSTAHEALACTKGEVTVQLGGPNGEIIKVRKGDVVLLPAGTSHKKLDASENFEIVGAYPENDHEVDFQYGDDNVYDTVRDNIAKVKQPLTDPVSNSPKDIHELW